MRLQFLRNMKNFDAVRMAAGVLCAAALLASCGKTASVKGHLEGAPEAEVVVKLLDVNRYEVLDTVKTVKDGNFRFKVNVSKGDPEFVYMFYGDTKIASVLLFAGDRIWVEADTLGHFTATGSAETELLAGVEKDYAEFASRFAALAREAELCAGTEREADALKAMSDEYVTYYRDRTKYVMSNPFSLTVVPVLFQNASPDLPVFSQATDAIHFKNACDSLSSVYPDSKYVRALRQETERRRRIFELGSKIRNAGEMNFPEIDLPDVNGVRRKLSEVDAKIVILYFWTQTEPLQKMFNLDELAPVYRDYKSKGVEIYQVAVDTDKAAWARTVKAQGLEWINVCDGLGTASPVVGTYNVGKLPMMYIISDGQIVNGEAADGGSLRKVLDGMLR